MTESTCTIPQTGEIWEKKNCPENPFPCTIHGLATLIPTRQTLVLYKFEFPNYDSDLMHARELLDFIEIFRLVDSNQTTSNTENQLMNISIKSAKIIKEISDTDAWIWRVEFDDPTVDSRICTAQERLPSQEAALLELAQYILQIGKNAGKLEAARESKLAL